MDNATDPHHPDVLASFMRIREIPEGLDHGWKVFLNGEPVENVRMLVITSNRGSFILAFREEDGFASPLFVEEGGVVILPFSQTEDGMELVAGIKEFRANTGGVNLFALGGMRLEGQEICSTVKEKVLTKVPELSLRGIDRFREFREIITDRLYKVTDPNQEGRGGISALEVSVPFSQLEELEDGNYGLKGTDGKLYFVPLGKLGLYTGDSLLLSMGFFRTTRLIEAGKLKWA